ncbi:RDD family protein [Hymenobacter sp. H14-R3]|uniref:RDD family protein n=1 Tax=Hymenobacter sp. H14-R3 TaxID=3046308 RepID=UPI0024BAE493|nr:RDD family protein [Hymenobacter sp. H14-R3]MDJ0365025.1 RDD family protein [Hymenobacter sp. H14-R3]
MEASKVRRFVNWAVDIGCVLFLFLALLRILPVGLIKTEYYRFAVFGVMFMYYAIAEIAFKRTIGKLLTGTHLVTQDDTDPTSGQLFIRTICRFLPLEPISLLFSRRKMAWHDKFSSTKVIYLD